MFNIYSVLLYIQRTVNDRNMEYINLDMMEMGR